MLIFSVCLLFISLISTQVHSFDIDTEANQSQRFVRHAHADGGRGFGKFDMNKCCNVETTDAQTEYMDKIRDFKTECVKEIFGEGPPQKGPAGFVCISECIGKKMKILDEAKNFNEDAFRTSVNEMAFAEHQKAIADETATKCIDEVKKAATEDDTPMPHPDGSDCSKLAMKAYFCAGREFIKSCPAEARDQSDHCVEFHKMVEAGHFRKRFDPKRGFGGFNAEIPSELAGIPA